MIVAVGIDMVLVDRFAVREAVAKALGVPEGLHWHDGGIASAMVVAERPAESGKMDG